MKINLTESDRAISDALINKPVWDKPEELDDHDYWVLMLVILILAFII